ncbi:MAG: site-specific integrase [Lachnospiraceae bacterium]|nr:site-specific integrase [Lachnospiraceae bacterium]
MLDYLESIPQTVYTLAVRLAFCFCMRIGELRALEWSDYDAENQKMHIWKQVVAVKKNGRKRSDELVYHTKSNCPEGERYVYVSDEATQVLKELREINGEKQFILNGINGAQFAISENGFNEHLREFCTAAGVKYYSSHKIRFYGCTELLDAGVPARTVQKIMGHKYASTTEHYDRSKKKDKVDEGIWNDVFGSGLRGSTR